MTHRLFETAELSDVFIADPQLPGGGADLASEGKNFLKKIKSCNSLAKVIFLLRNYNGDITFSSYCQN